MKDSHPPHIAFKIKNKEDLKKINILDQDFKEHRDGSHSAYLKDPFGNFKEWVIYPEDI